ncbi:E3 UFM1-protein ligase 1 homolog isoform X2 [Physcomitrium patens]|uniref:E3 UFM1-protein ligase 1 homolog n=1 Tax=Physcomitrium patens TaxID=3218 RepID=A0A7I4EDP3_PHYPA|nr:E3 UFM1-protein ligase 1 homolog isoform X2 [Physcomitrium patens]|eukprot:XP_024383367.1 E3 UFM1-protein ligase 1 homolog isoform X2 [Physcomitrella patens]
MDLELEELQKLFEQTQNAKAKVRLSERNVVELVSKLQALKLLDNDLLHTVSGKEYITQDELKREIESEIQRLGRVSLVDLSGTLGVELVHCERQAQQIVQNNPSLSLMQGEILSSGYWDSIAEEINESLEVAGQISIVELARRFTVGAELMTNVLSARLGTSIHGKLEGGQLYTPAFVARIRATVRGAVRAIMVPTSVSTLSSFLQQQMREVDEGPITKVTADGGLFQSVLNQLIADGEVKGSLRGGNAVYTPAVFAGAQRGSVEAFFSQNGYITFDTLRKLNVPQPKQYLQEMYKDGVALEDVFVHSSLISQLDAAAEEAIAGKSWFDVLPLVPSSIGPSDAEKLVVLCPTVQKALKDGTAVILADTCVLSATFVKDLLEKLENLARDLTKKRVENKKFNKVSTQSLSEGVTGISTTDTGTEDASGQLKGGRRKKGNQSNGATRPAPEIEAVVPKEGKGKRRAGKSKGEKVSGEAVAGVSKGFKSGTGPNSANDEDNIFTVEFLTSKILEWFPDLESAGIEEEVEEGILVKALADLLKPKVMAAAIHAKQALFSAQAEDRRRRLDTLQHKIDEIYSNFQLFSKALNLFEDNEKTGVLLHRHLLRTTGAELVDLFLIAQAEDDIDDKEVGITATKETELLNTSQRTAMAKSLPARNLSSKALELVESLEAKNVDAFERTFEAAVTESGLRVKKLDKKSERALMFSYRKGLTSQVGDETDSVALLPKVVGLLFVQVHSRALQAPGRAMLAAIMRLKGSIPDELFEVLMAYHNGTVQLLSLQTSANLEETDASNETITKQEELKTLIPQLKSMVLPSSSSASTTNDKQQQ